MKNPLISVIIPVYNCERYLQFCVESLLRQTVQSLEIILVDDGSQDGSAAICDDYVHRDHRVKAVHTRNQGAAAARKTGIDYATGQYVMFVDSDDWLDADYTETLLDCTKQRDPDIVVGLMRGQDEEGNITEYNHFFPCGFFENHQLHEVIFRHMLSAMPYYTFGIAPAMWGKLFKYEIARKNMYALETGIVFGEDGCFTYSALLDAESIYIVDSCGYNYRTNSASVTHRFNEKLWSDGEKLRAFLTGLANEKKWNVGTQIDEYMSFVCNAVVTKAILAGYAESMKGRERLKVYIKHMLPHNLFHNEKFKKSNLRTKLKFWLIKHYALQILSVIINKRKWVQ